MGRREFLRWLFGLLACTVLLFWGADAILDRIIVRKGSLADAVDIQTPSTLFAKIDYLRRFPGYKVVLLGDSVVYGRTLEEHGDADWRQHTLESLLTEKLQKALPGRDVLVMNLALNGALPADLECVAALLKHCPTDLLIFDVGLRSFSEDFAAEKERLSRSWLRGVTISHHGHFRDAPPAGTIAGSLVTGLDNFLTNHWELYRLRDFIRARWLDGQPRTFLQALRDRVNQTLLGPAEGVDADVALAAKAKPRFKTVNFRPDNPQRQALERLLTRLKQRGQKTLVFYAKESPERVGAVLDADRHRTLSAELQKVVRRHENEGLAFLPPIEALAPQHFLDLVHLNREGYEILADRIWQVLPRLRVLPEQKR